MITMNDLKGNGAKFFGAGGSGPVSWDSLPDKPFGEEIKLLWSAKSIANGKPTRPMYIEDENGERVYLSLKEGASYQIEYDGTVYQCTAFSYTADGATVNVAIGNPELIPGYEHNGSANSAPVVFMDSEDGATYCVEDSEEHSIKIFEEVIYTLDPKYLPESVGAGLHVVLNLAADGTITANKTFAEISEAIESGQPVSCVTKFVPLGTYTGASLMSYMPNKLVVFATVEIEAESIGQITYAYLTQTESWQRQADTIVVPAT